MSDRAVKGGNFTFVYIPADEKEPLVELHASKSGGLTDDRLLQHVKQHFTKQQQHSSEASVNITALTVPTADNGYRACSLYSRIPASTNDVLPNPRANALLTACGHQVRFASGSEGGNAIYGDAFVGRAWDDESRDWERLDFGAHEVDPAAEWCRQARAVGGGGGAGCQAAASLVQLAQQMGTSVASGSASPQETTTLTKDAPPSYGLNGATAVHESWGTWTQTAEEVELKLAVPKETTTKECRVQFHRNRIRVALNDQVLLEGTSFDPISLDESTFTLQNDGPTGRELCITIGKVDVGRTWMYVAK